MRTHGPSTNRPGRRSTARSARMTIVAALLAAVGAGIVATWSTTAHVEVAPDNGHLLPAERLDPPDRHLLLGFVGDIHMHRKVTRSAFRSSGAYDYAPMFEYVRPLLEPLDLAVCHLEQPFAPPGQPLLVEPPLLSSAGELAQGLASAGFDRCGTASNHAMDRGVEGVKVTLDAMDAAGLGHSGTARTPEEATPQVFEVKGVKIAQLAYTFGSNLGTPPGQKWRLNISNPAGIVADARRARALGAQLVVVTIEWGDDQIVDPTPEQRRIAAAITASHDIDLIVGYQAHVLQPISKVNGTWVVWGMGNFISDHPVSSNWPASSQDGAIFTVDVTVDDNGASSVGKPLVIPTWCDRTNRHVILPTYLSRSDTLPAWKRQQLELSAKRTARVVGDHIAPGS